MVFKVVTIKLDFGLDTPSDFAPERLRRVWVLFDILEAGCDRCVSKDAFEFSLYPK